MNVRRFQILAVTSGLVALAVVAVPALAQEIRGTVKSVDPANSRIVLTDDTGKHEINVVVTKKTAFDLGKTSKRGGLGDVKPGMHVVVANTITASRLAVDTASDGSHAPPAVEGPLPSRSILGEFWYNFRHNLFKPLLL